LWSNALVDDDDDDEDDVCEENGIKMNRLAMQLNHRRDAFCLFTALCETSPDDHDDSLLPKSILRDRNCWKLCVDLRAIVPNITRKPQGQAEKCTKRYQYLSSGPDNPSKWRSIVHSPLSHSPYQSRRSAKASAETDAIPTDAP
jgi:hypothetical protein